MSSQYGNLKIIRFEDLSHADLHVDALYKGGTAGNLSDDPISKLLKTGNQGGFRYIVDSKSRRALYCVLYSNLTELEWPDSIDLASGRFIYYGDNRRPGHELHDSLGNRFLREVFENLHSGKRGLIPPFFVFTKGAEGRDVVFRGLAVPGAPGLSSKDDLVAVWRLKSGTRFQNYRAIFTILDEGKIDRSWIEGLRAANPSTAAAPRAWSTWVENGKYEALIASPSKSYRTKDEQIPELGTIQDAIVNEIIVYFKEKHPKREYAFEKCAAEIVRLMDVNVMGYDLTRPWRDGGRDAIGDYHIGPRDHGLSVEFALEAKCKRRNNGSGVREISRLISRLRHRQFGIFVTTSYVSEQAYKEIVEDRHPVVVISGSDIARIMIESGYSTVERVRSWLEEEFPPQ